MSDKVFGIIFDKNTKEIRRIILPEYSSDLNNIHRAETGEVLLTVVGDNYNIEFCKELIRKSS